MPRMPHCTRRMPCLAACLLTADLVATAHAGGETARHYLLAISHGTGLELVRTKADHSGAVAVATTSRKLACASVWHLADIAVGLRCTDATPQRG